jgi:hypothetical protein
MLSAETEELLRRCAEYVHELAEIYQFGGTNRAHLLDDLDGLYRLIHESANGSRRSGVARDLARNPHKRAVSNSRTWLEDIVDAFRSFRGEASYEDLYPAIYSRADRQFPKEWKAVVRNTIEMHSRDSANFKGTHVFDHVGLGRWRLA